MALWRRSVQRRPAAAAGLWLVVVLACALATAGPVLLRASEQAGLLTRIAQEKDGGLDIVATARNGDYPQLVVVDAVTAVAGAARSRLFGPPLFTRRSDKALSWRIGPASLSGVAVGAGSGCALLVLTAGRCPAAGDGVVAAAAPGRQIGDPVTVVGHPGVLRLVGTYRIASGPSWLIASGAVFVGDDTLQRLAPVPVVSARARLRPERLDLDAIASAQRSVAAARATLLTQTVVASVDTDLPNLADDVRADSRVAEVIGLITVVPAVVLCWYSLILIMQLIGQTRSREWALGRLRGLARFSWLRSLYAEQAVVVVTGAAVGFLVGAAVSTLTARLTMPTGTPIELDRLPVFIAWAGTVAGALVGTAIATVVATRRPLAALLLQSAEPARATRAAVATQVVLLVLTALAVVQLVTRRQVTVEAGDLGVLVPGLLAALVGVIGIRVWSQLVRRRAAGPPRSLSGLLIGRRLARSSGLLARYLVLAVAAAVGTFAVSLIVILQRNTDLRAGNALGAATVVQVGRVPPDRLLAAVRAVDPGARRAMAVEQLTGTVYGGTSRVVAVDASRLAAVSDWRAGWAGLSARAVEQRLVPAHRPSLTVTGRRLTVAIRDAQTAVSPADITPTAPAPHPELSAILQRPGQWVTVALGPVAPGDSTLSAPIPCASGCVLRALEFANPTERLYAGTLTIAAVSTDARPSTEFAGRLADTASWQSSLVGASPGLPVLATARGSRDGLLVRLRDDVGSSTSALLPADGPALVPAVLARAVEAQPLPAFQGAVDGTGLDTSQQPIRVVARAAALPSSVNDGVLVDLATIARLTDPAASQASAEVWLNRDAPASMPAALRRAGLTITRIEHVGPVRDELLAASTARAAVANLAAAILLALLASAAIAAGVTIDGDRRRREGRLLRDAGLTPRTVRRLSFVEIAVPTTVAVLIGAAAGCASVVIAGARLPLFADPVGPPLAVAPAWAATAAVVGIVLVAALLPATVSIAVQDRRSVGRRR